MEARNASVQFENYAYNMSGVTTEQSEMRSAAIHGKNINNTYNGIEFINEKFDDDYDLQDIEIIAIDPNSFYTSSDSGSDEGNDNDEQEMQASTSASVDSTPFELQPILTDDFDIITLNIDDDFPIDPQDDEILFKNDHQFDLASYIGGESTSLLLSPVNDAVNLRQRMRVQSLSDFTHLDQNVCDVSRTPINANHDKVTKTPASNRRKRKNLSREFIESDDSDEDDKTSASNAIKPAIDDGKRNKAVKSQKNTDPVWCPPSEKRTAKMSKQLPDRAKEIVNRKELKDLKNITKAPPTGQGKGLRNMLMQQMFSDRPINKAKLLKTMTAPVPSSPLEKVNTTKVAPYTVKTVGVGRGKDIAITAKYYNCTESSDNSERDKSYYKHDRYRQIYTDSDESDSDSSSDSDTDIDVNSEPEPLPKVISKEKEDSVVEIECNKRINEIKEKPLQVKIERKTSPPSKRLIKESSKRTVNIRRKTQITCNKPVIIDSKSLDSTDFAKALVTNAKLVPKTKSSGSLVAKKNHLEQQKRIIKSNLLLQNPAKFKMFATEKTKAPSDDNLSSSEIKVPATIAPKCTDEPCKVLPVFEKKVEKVPPSENQIKNETEKVNNDVLVSQEVNEDVKPEILTVDENKVESNAKRKLNVQEYLKRKSLKMSHNISVGVKDDLIENMKSEQPENEAQNNANRENGESKNDEPSNNLVGNSMYEEIIIVSMGCNTDISIPEASFIQPSEIKSVKSTVLLSDIQTSVEKANSKISCCSLISSIQDVILKKTHCIEQNGKKESKGINGDADASNVTENVDEKEEHGENKVIMHLRKDRVRPMRVSTSIQTDPYFQFPPLQKFTPLSKKQSISNEKRTNSIPRDSRLNEAHFLHSDGKNRTHRNYRGRSHLSESSYYSDEEEKMIQRPSRHSEFMEHKTVRHKRMRCESGRYSSSKYDKYISRHRTISRSLSSSSDNSTTSTDSSSTSKSSSSSSTYVSSASARSLNSYGGSSSKSYYGDDHQYYRKRTTSNNSKRSNTYRQGASKRTNSPEERRIVYVGRIEEEITKEELRRKFSVYGQVKHISIHYKETKMRYGFVTFVRPGDAYTAIDDSSKNPAISHYDVSFGGRRAFCREKYFDLDNTGHTTYREETPQITTPNLSTDDGDSFDVLLRKMKEKLQENKK